MIPATNEGLGYTNADFRRLQEIANGGQLTSPQDVRRVIDNCAYLDDWRVNYRIQSVRSSLQSSRVTCIDAAILSYGLLELLCSGVKRRILAIHRRDPKTDEECGHCVTLYWGSDGRVGALSKSSFQGLGHRAPTFSDETSIASSYAQAYIAIGFEPLYFGVTTLERVAPDLDWRLHPGDLNELSARLQACYEYGFAVGRHDG